MIKIMVDSASDCRREDGNFDLFVPITITLDGKEYADGVDIDSDAFYKMLTESDSFPKTAQPSPQVFAEIFEKIMADGDELIYFALSSKLSGTWQSACIAKNMVGYDKIHVVDSLGATHMIAYLATYAAECIKEGLSAEATVERCAKVRSHMRVYAGVDTLEYLYRGGRLSRASAAVGGLAGVKPIVTVNQNGEVEAIGKTIGKVKAMQFILKQLDGCEVDESFPVCSLYSSGEDNCDRLEEMIEQKGLKVSGRLQIGSTIGAHVGPGAYGMIFIAKE